jgi:signal transduction histidine kinase
MNIYSLPPLLAVILTTCFLVLLDRHSQNKNIKRIGFIYSCFIIWWQFGYAILFSIKDVAVANIISKMIYTGVVFLPTYWGQFFYYICTDKRSKYCDWCFYLSMLFVPFIWFSDLFVKGVHTYYFGFYTHGGILHLVHIGMTLTIVYHVVATSIKYLRTRRRQQATDVLIGFIVAMFSATDYIIKHGFEFYPFGWLFVSASVGFVLYRIIFGTFADLSILAKKLKAEVEKEKEKSLYLVKIFAHDIKNRLVSGMMSLKVAQRKDNKNRHIVQSYNDQKHMNRMVGNLINVFLDDQIILNKQKVDVAELIDDFNDEWSLKFEDKDIQFAIEKGSIESILIDPDYMELVWENLFANALHNTPEGGKFKLTIHENERHANFTFGNSGKVVPEEYRSALFEKYLKPKEHSAYNKGLGLHYSKMMSERHEGNLEYSISEQGLNEFIVTLPLE